MALSIRQQKVTERFQNDDERNQARNLDRARLRFRRRSSRSRQNGIFRLADMGGGARLCVDIRALTPVAQRGYVVF